MTKLTVAVVLALGAAAVLGAPAAAKPASSQGAGISSIAPATADRGGTVTIAGHGFGGPNVQITVAGISAEVLSTTGSNATFRVPARAVLAPGQYVLTVEAEAGSSEGNGRPTPTHAYAIQVAFTEPS